MAERRRDDLGAEAPRSDAIVERSLDFDVGYDPDTAVYYVVSSGIPGLHVEAQTFEGFVGIVQDVAPRPGCTFVRTGIARDLVQPRNNAKRGRAANTMMTGTANGILKDAGLPKAY